MLIPAEGAFVFIIAGKGPKAGGGGSYRVPHIPLYHVSIDRVQELGDFPVIHAAGVQEHVIPGGIHHGQDAQRGLGIDVEFPGTKRNIVPEFLADAAQLLRSLHRIDVNVNVHGASFRKTIVLPGTGIVSGEFAGLSTPAAVV
jgi:hypothetical protein